MTHGGERADLHGGFVFRGGVLALELVNTEIAVRGKAQDLLRTPEDLARWWAIVQERYSLANEEPEQGLASPELLAATHRLRGALRRACTAVTQAAAIGEDDLALINQALALAHPALAQAPTGELRQINLLAPGASPLLFPIARSALDLLTQTDPRRLHRCRNERCVLLFYDSTKSSTRQWCSLDCFNRTRSSENYRRRKASGQIQE